MSIFSWLIWSHSTHGGVIFANLDFISHEHKPVFCELVIKGCFKFPSSFSIMIHDALTTSVGAGRKFHSFIIIAPCENEFPLSRSAMARCN